MGVVETILLDCSSCNRARRLKEECIGRCKFVKDEFLDRGFATPDKVISLITHSRERDEFYLFCPMNSSFGLPFRRICGRC